MSFPFMLPSHNEMGQLWQGICHVFALLGVALAPALSFVQIIAGVLAACWYLYAFYSIWRKRHDKRQ